METRLPPDGDEMISNFMKRNGAYADYMIREFWQIWYSTSLGFDEPGEPRMIKAYTTVIQVASLDKYDIYFDGRYAYSVETPTDVFFEDLQKKSLKPITGSDVYGVVTSAEQ